MRDRAIAGRGTGWAWAVLAVVLAVPMHGCGGRGDGGADPRANGDDAGADLQRIVCGSPAVAEFVFALGCGDRVVGVSDYTVYPPEATAKTRIGGWANPNRERLLALRPDLVVTQGEHTTLAAFTREYGIRFHAAKLDTLEDIHTAVDSIANALGVAERGAALNRDIRSAMRAVSEPRPEEPPKRVLLLVGRTPGAWSGLATVGPGTFLGDLVRIAGGRNVFGDATGAYPQVSKESLLVREPDVILEIQPGGAPEETIARLRADWREFATIPAVRNGRIHVLTDDFLLIPGPRVARVAEVFAAAIRGEPADE